MQGMNNGTQHPFSATNQALSSIRTTGTNLERAKTHNHRVVLEVIRTQGPLSRADIARITLLSRQTIQNIVAELNDVGLVQLGKAASPEKSRGRGHPGVMVSFRADSGYCLGVHLDQFSLGAVLTDMTGSIVWSDRHDVIYPAPEDAAEVISGILSELRGKMPHRAAQIIGIGLAMPGPFNVTGITSVGPTTLPEWTDSRSVQWMEEQLGVPVVVENDAAAACLGESLFGVGKAFEHFAYIYFGLGLGAGIFCNGSLYRGKGMNAGEIGHMIVDPGGRACPCGNTGCLERYVSLQSIYDALDIVHPDSLSVELVEQCFAQGDPRIHGWLEQAMPRLRQAVNILESVLDPETIILGGIVPQSVLDAIDDAMCPLFGSISGDGRETHVNRVLVGTSGPETTARGAAALAVYARIGPCMDMLLKK